MNDDPETFEISLNIREMQALWRACIEYGRVLELSALRDSTLIGGELSHLENLKEKISLTFFYPSQKG